MHYDSTGRHLATCSIKGLVCVLRIDEEMAAEEEIAVVKA